MRVMELSPCKPGYWYVNTAPLGEKPTWEQHPMPHDNSGKLFGYDEKEFMRKQYR